MQMPNAPLPEHLKNKAEWFLTEMRFTDTYSTLGLYRRNLAPQGAPTLT